jgi:hypothetical protein
MPAITAARPTNGHAGFDAVLNQGPARSFPGPTVVFIFRPPAESSLGRRKACKCGPRAKTSPQHRWNIILSKSIMTLAAILSILLSNVFVPCAHRVNLLLSRFSNKDAMRFGTSGLYLASASFALAQ